MELIESEAKAPSGAIVNRLVASPGVALRVARWGSEGAGLSARGTVVICTGRSEFIEKYYEVVSDLRQRGFAVLVFDWRGQGLSDRLLKNRRKGHIRAFRDFEADLEAVRDEVLHPYCPPPWFCLAHSMGGPIALGFSARHPDVFQRLVLSAPMIEIARLPSPALSRVLARVMCGVGLGRHVIPVWRNKALFLSTFEGNVLTSDRRRFARTASLLQAEPALSIGPPTFGWLNAAFASIASLHSDGFHRDFATPTLIVMPGADAVVDGPAAERFAARLRACTLVSVPGAQHEVLMERDTFRQQFWAAFDQFIPGSRSSAEPAAMRCGKGVPAPVV